MPIVRPSLSSTTTVALRFVSDGTTNVDDELMVETAIVLEFASSLTLMLSFTLIAPPPASRREGEANTKLLELHRGSVLPLGHRNQNSPPDETRFLTGQRG